MTTERASPGTESGAAATLRDLRQLPAERRFDALAALGPRVLNLSADQQADEPSTESNLLALIEEAGRLTMVSATEALEATAVVVELADQSELDLPRARARRARARALAYAGRFEEALVACSEAISIAMRCGRLEEAGRARLAAMHALTEMGRLDEAVDAGRAARATFEQLGAADLAARADNNLGIVFQRSDEPAAAIDCFERARPALASEPVALGHLENSRGEALLALNDFTGAERAFTAALAAFEQGKVDLTAAIAEGNLGDLAMRRGRFQDAMSFFERARRRFEQCDSPGHLARLIAEQAEAKALIGLNADALRDYEQALAGLEKSGMPLEAARARTAMGMAHFRTGRLSEAETALAAAAAAFEDLHHGTARARVDLVRAEIAARNGRLGDARTIALRALAALHARPVDAAASRLLLGQLAAQMGEFDLAEAEMRIASAAAETLGIAPMQAEIHHSLGRLYRDRGRREEAIENLFLAAESADRIRATIQAERFRTAFLGQRTDLYEELAACLLDQADEQSIQRAFEVAERCKSRTLLDRLAPAAAQAAIEIHESDPDDGDLAQRMQCVLEDLNATYSRLGDERFARQSAAALRTWRSRVRKLENELGEVESRLASARGVVSLHAPGATFEQVRSALRPGEALVEYFGIGDRLAVFVVMPDGPAFAQQLPSRPLSLTIERLQFQIDRALRRLTSAAPTGAKGGRTAGADDRLLADARRELGALYDHLIAPIESALEGASNLVIVPHGPLHGLPFHALWDARRGEYLDDRFTICTAPSASVFAQGRCTSRSIARSSRSLVVAVPDEFVPDVLDEGRAVAGILGGTLLAEDEATLANVRDRAPEASILHFACHGRFDASLPGGHGSGLQLADGWLTLRDIYGLRLNAELVFLSACETGLGRIEGGDEVLGLQRAFLAAGAGALVLSLWQVPDKTTADFARHFYSARDTDEGNPEAPRPSGPTVADVARRARAALRSDHPHNAHPAAWAPFAVTGGQT